MIDVKDMFWETYDDQEDGIFDFIGYHDLSGQFIVKKIDGCLADMAEEIYRRCGANTEIRVYSDRKPAYA